MGTVPREVPGFFERPVSVTLPRPHADGEVFLPEHVLFIPQKSLGDSANTFDSCSYVLYAVSLAMWVPSL